MANEIEKLTDAEINWPTPAVFGKALRIVDALTAALAQAVERSDEDIALLGIAAEIVELHSAAVKQRDAALARAEAADFRGVQAVEASIAARAAQLRAESEAAALRADRSKAFERADFFQAEHRKALDETFKVIGERDAARADNAALRAEVERLTELAYSNARKVLDAETRRAAAEALLRTLTGVHDGDDVAAARAFLSTTQPAASAKGGC